MPRAPVRHLGTPGRFLFSCEHASNHLQGVAATPADRALLDDHWGYDPGAAALTEALVARTASEAILSDFSRLLIDPNRPLTSDTLIVAACAGQPVSFNQGLTAAARQHRVDALYTPYHQALDAAVAARAGEPVYLVSIHSFTPVFGDDVRPMHIGVLFDDHEADARALAAALARDGTPVALNAPYSGRGGLIFAIEQAGRAHGRPHLELEIRQDLLRTPAAVAAMADRIAAALVLLATG
ncbi:MAG: N-formylglutamate amidohydrolase [Myxococcales bacterium]|nr:N-formylglutamate amidohydrolase [Myxococcales bacterium]MCB9547296.1 N-formylglutamate amidohydrolase [Myxococcales bacterium]